MKLDSKTILLIVASLIVAAGAYWYFFTGTGNQPPLTTDVQQNEAQTRFSTLVSKLTPISFNTSIFSDPNFAALVDLSTPIAPESAGRLDPFATVPGVSGK